MSKVADERFWYLAQGYGPGGWRGEFMQGFKKWDIHRAQLLKNGFLEKHEEYELYRITDKGIQRVAETKYRHFLPKMMMPSGDDNG